MKKEPNRSVVFNVWSPNGKHIARTISNVREALAAAQSELDWGYTLTILPFTGVKLPRTFDTRKVPAR